MNFQSILKQKRKKLGYTLKDVAYKMGVTEATVQRWESGNIKSLRQGRIAKLAEILETTPAALMGWENEEQNIDDKINSAFNVIDNKYLRSIPVYESVSAGFGAYADSRILEYIPTYIKCDYEAENTICIKVVGDSMYPKIEDGDIIQVLKQDSVDSGSVAVVLVDGDEGLVKKVIYGSDWIELHSFNPIYKTMRFNGADVQRIRIVGLVKTVIKRFA